MHFVRISPRVPYGTLAGVAGGDAGELALEGRGGGPAVQPFHFGGGSDEGSIVRLRCSASAVVSFTIHNSPPHAQCHASREATLSIIPIEDRLYDYGRLE